jgi:hypothetical protein
MAAMNNPRFSNMGRESSEREANQNAGTAGVMESVKEGAENVASSVSSAAGQAWDATRQGAQQAAEIAGDAFESATEFMRRYPIATLAIGMCMGFTLGMALQGRRT